MEEKNNKEVKMGVVKNQDNSKTLKQEKNPTFDELYNAYMDLAQKHQYAVQQLQQANRMLQTFNRLDYLFRVVEIQNASKSSLVFTDKFYYDCVHEIEDIITVPDGTESPKEN